MHRARTMVRPLVKIGALSARGRATIQSAARVRDQIADSSDELEREALRALAQRLDHLASRSARARLWR
jgi:hypothetical protein